MNKWQRCVSSFDEVAAGLRKWRGASMVSGFGTMFGNFLGTGLNVATKPARTFGAAVADLPIAAITGQRSRYFTEVMDDIYGLTKALPSAWKATARLARATREIDEIAAGNAGGVLNKAVNIPYKLLSVTDQFWYDTTFHSEMLKAARRQAIKSGKTIAQVMDEQAGYIPRLSRLGEEINKLKDQMIAARKAGQSVGGLSARVTKLVKEREEIYKKSFVGDASLMAERAIFTAREGETLDKTIDLIEQMEGIGGLAHIILPFKRTPANVVREAIRGTPVGAVTGAIRAVKGKASGAATAAVQGRLSDDMGQAIMGTAMMYSMIHMAESGFLKANPYKERARAERVTEEAGGVLPNTVQIGDWSIPVSRLEPFGSYLLNAARVAEAVKNGEAPENLVDSLVMATENLVLLSAKETFLDPFSEFGEAIQDDKTLARYMQQLGASFVPRAVTQFDQTVRETGEGGFLAGLKSKTPGLGGPAKLGLFGAERESQAPLASILMGRTGKVGNDPVAAEMMRVGAYHDAPTGLSNNYVKKLEARGISYSDAEDRTLQINKGRAQRMMVERVVNSPQYQDPRVSDQMRKAMIDAAFKEASRAIDQRAKMLKAAKVPITAQGLFGR